jgi:hypothetical protein
LILDIRDKTTPNLIIFFTYLKLNLTNSNVPKLTSIPMLDNFVYIIFCAISKSWRKECYRQLMGFCLMAKLVNLSKSRQWSLLQRRGGNHAVEHGDETCHKNYFFVGSHLLEMCVNAWLETALIGLFKLQILFWSTLELRARRYAKWKLWAINLPDTIHLMRALQWRENPWEKKNMFMQIILCTRANGTGTVTKRDEVSWQPGARHRPQYTAHPLDWSPCLDLGPTQI